VMRFEADSPDHLDAIKQVVEKRIKALLP
jgi:hypothetical protein